jgi:hypothetical protein
MDGLPTFDRATVALWSRGYAELQRESPRVVLAEVAVQALLARLRPRTRLTTLFAAYAADTTPDLVLLGSLLIGDRAARFLRAARDAAYYLRWLELTVQPTSACSTSLD